MAEPLRWSLHITDESGPVRIVRLDADDVVIGRSADVTVQLDWPTVSRRHARLTRQADGQWRVSDLDSRGGTLVNQQRVQTAVLKSGDVVSVSRFSLRLVCDDVSRRGKLSTPRSTWGEETPGSQISVLTHIAPPKLDMTQIAALHDFGRELMTLDTPQARLQRLCETMTGQTIRARWVMALRVEAADPTHPPQQLAIFPPEAAQRDDIHVSRSTIRAMQESGAPVLASNFRRDDGVVEMSIVAKSPATAVVACPLSDEPGSHDLLYVNLPPVFGSAEWMALIALAVKQYQQVEAAWVAREAIRVQTAMERDLVNARQIQRSILPTPAALPGLDVAWSFEPCDQIGGDFVDVVPMADGRVLLAIADVSGHGLPAALATLAVHSVLHTSLRSGLSVSRMMTTLNEHLCDYLPTGRFVTMLSVAVDPRTGECECFNAGHQPPMILAADGQTRDMPVSDHYPLGLERFDFVPQHDTVAPGDALVILTDGITELHLDDGSELGMERTRRLLDECVIQSSAGLDACVASIRDRLVRFRGDRPSLDDQTFLLARRRPATDSG